MSDPSVYRAARRGNRRRWGRVLTIVGAVLLLAGLAMGAAFARTIEDIVPALDQSTRADGGATATLRGDDMLVLYAPTATRPTCRITGPGGQPPDTDLGGTRYSFTVNGVSYESIAKIGGPGQPAGDYVVECDEDGVILAPPLRISGILGTVFVLVGAIGAGTLGGTLLIVGLVMWGTGRHRE